MAYQIVRLLDQPEKKEEAAQWFHEKWGIPLEAYLESMEECLREKGAVPQWYMAVEGERIIGGMGVIENDFHNRKDLAPNVCAVYTEESHRRQGVAGALLDYVCKDMERYGVDTLYLLTNHTSFYERFGWNFLCMVQGDGEEEMARMYIHKEARRKQNGM
jgi:Predicted acetyltransferase involved in intracellular survival and related acetyltransferases